jgi:WD40 repeat protein
MQVRFAPDDRSILMRDHDEQILLWDVARGNGHQLDLARGTEHRIAYRADGTPLLFLPPRDKTVEVVNAETGALFAHLSLPAKVDYLQISARGDLLFSRAGARMFLSSIPSGKLVGSFAGPSGAVRTDISDNGERVAWSGFDQSVEVVDIETASTRKFVLSHRLIDLALSPDGRWLAVGMVNGDVEVIDLVGGDSRLLLGQTQAIYPLQFSSDGKTLLSGAVDATVRLWSLQERGRVLDVGAGNTLWATFSPDGRRLALASNSGATVWDVSRGRPVWQTHHDMLARSIALSPDGKWLASAGWDRKAKWANLDTTATGSLLHEDRVQLVLWLDNGSALATGTFDGAVWLWNVASGSRRLLCQHSAPVTRLLSSPDGDSVLSSSEDGTVRLSSIANGTSRLISRVGGTAIATFLPDGRTIAVVGADGSAKLFAIGSDSTRILRASGAALRDVAAASDGARIAAGSDNGDVIVWTSSTGAGHVLEGHSGVVSKVAFSPDGQFVAAAGRDDHATWIWSLTTGDAAMLGAHEGRMLVSEYSPDGRVLATAGGDATVRLWQVDRIPMMPTESSRFRSWVAGATNLTIVGKETE